MFLMFLYHSDEEGVSKGLKAKKWQNLLLWRIKCIIHNNKIKSPNLVKKHYLLRLCIILSWSIGLNYIWQKRSQEKIWENKERKWERPSRAWEEGSNWDWSKVGRSKTPVPPLVKEALTARFVDIAITLFCGKFALVLWVGIGPSMLLKWTDCSFVEENRVVDAAVNNAIFLVLCILL